MEKDLNKFYLEYKDFSVGIFRIKAWSHYTDLDGLTGYVGISEPKGINGITNILLNDPSF